MKKIVFTIVFGSFFILPLSAEACASGARCLTPPKTSTPLFVPGDILKPGSFNVLMNSQYHGLPKVTDGSWYVTVDRRILRIEPDTYMVIEDVTSEARRAF